jgi:hypothetical protein
MDEFSGGRAQLDFDGIKHKWVKIAANHRTGNARKTKAGKAKLRSRLGRLGLGALCPVVLNGARRTVPEPENRVLS